MKIKLYCCVMLLATIQTVPAQVHPTNNSVAVLQLPTFDAIKVSGPITIHIVQGLESRVAVSTEKPGQLNKVQAEVVDGVLL